MDKRLFVIGWSLIGLGLAAVSLSGAGATTRFTVTVTLPKDRGQSLGTLFELRSAKGDLLVGAGFALANNTTQASNPRILSVYLKSPDQPPRLSNLGKPFPDHLPIHLLNLKDTLVALPYNQIGYIPKVYIPGSNSWREMSMPFEKDSADLMVMQAVDGEVLLLRYYGARMYYRGKEIATPKPWRHLVANDVYYLDNHVYVFLQDPSSNHQGSVAVCRWAPGKHRLVPVNHFTLAGYGFFYCLMPDAAGSALLAADRLGRVYRIRPDQLTLEYDTPFPNASQQFYSALRWSDTLLFGHYPSGNLVDYNVSLTSGYISPSVGHQTRSTAGLREVQSLAIFGGRITAGIWPWGEIWEGIPGETWQLVARPFSGDTIGDAPFVDRVAAKGLSPPHALGQRIWGMANWGNGLAFSTSHYNLEQKEALDLLTPDEREAYGAVFLLEKEYELSCSIPGSGYMELSVEIRDDRLAVFQGSRLLAWRPINPVSVPILQGEFRPGEGVWGKFSGQIINASFTLGR